MHLKAPKFWKETGIFSYLLLPLSIIYYLSFNILKFLKREQRVKIPTICVGNINIGGTGKTPISIKIRHLLKNDFNNIFILLKGYKGKLNGPLLVNKSHTFTEVGDEAIIHYNYGTTCISKHKLKGARFCEQKGSDLIILDDGLQNKDLKKDFSILVVDSHYLFGNEMIFPAGPLRETLGSSLKRVDAIIQIGDKNKKKKFRGKKIFYAKRKIITNKKIKKNLFAFSGLGNNDNFFEMLKQDFNLVKYKGFPDHHHYKTDELNKILEFAKNNKLSVVCTYKDYLKIPYKFHKKIICVFLDIQFEKEREFKNFLTSQLKKR
tara:strand:- start:26 stop:985 length:960 start_codon:yes stop_codon:yes gene_type:complete